MHPAVHWAMRSPGAVLHNMWWRLAVASSGRKFLFIHGAPRSGTTLLQTCLAAHPQFFSVDGELTLFSFGQDIFRRERFSDYLPDEALEAIYARANSITEFADLLYDALTGGADDCVCVEKMPPHTLMARYLSRLFPQAKIVGIVRDGRDAYCSALGHDHVRQTLAPDVASFARAWRRRAERTLGLSRMRNAVLIRYEDLVRDPRRELGAVMAFAGAELCDAQLSPLARQRDRRARERAFSKLGGAIDAGSVGRWRRELDARQIEAFERAAGATLARAGYALSSDDPSADPAVTPSAQSAVLPPPRPGQAPPSFG